MASWGQASVLAAASSCRHVRFWVSQRRGASGCARTTAIAIGLGGLGITLVFREPWCASRNPGEDAAATAMLQGLELLGQAYRVSIPCRLPTAWAALRASPSDAAGPVRDAVHRADHAHDQVAGRRDSDHRSYVGTLYGGPRPRSVEHSGTAATASCADTRWHCGEAGRAIDLRRIPSTLSACCLAAFTPTPPGRTIFPVPEFLARAWRDHVG
jgi:hypothetical protein